MTWKERYPEKFCTEEEILRSVHRGDRIGIASGCAKPHSLFLNSFQMLGQWLHESLMSPSIFYFFILLVTENTALLSVNYSLYPIYHSMPCSYLWKHKAYEQTLGEEEVSIKAGSNMTEYLTYKELFFC